MDDLNLNTYSYFKYCTEIGFNLDFKDLGGSYATLLHISDLVSG